MTRRAVSCFSTLNWAFCGCCIAPHREMFEEMRGGANSLSLFNATAQQLAPEGGRSKEDISELLFSLASSDRLALLSEISKRKQRQAALSKLIDASPQECSRHLARLADSGFVRRDTRGFYETTSLG